MSFWATKFIFDDIPSDTYNLVCGIAGDGGESSSPSGADVEIIEDYLVRRSKPYFYGTKFTSKLEFTLSVFSEDEISRIKLQSIEQWLFGKKEYKKLQILQCDTYDIYFNCILTEGSIIAVGNQVYGIQCRVICDAPWGWGKGIKKTYITASTGTQVKFTNMSDDSSYLYPRIYITSSADQESVTITNVTDNSRVCTFSELYNDEEIFIDCDLKIITSTESGILDRFDGVYPRFIQGYNNVQVVGDLSDFSIEYSPARKVGS